LSLLRLSPFGCGGPWRCSRPGWPEKGA
jgi:hypothetical protein